MKCDSLLRLILPDDVDTFLRDTWARSTRLYPRSLGEAAGEILSLGTFELMLATLSRGHEGWLHFARGGLKQVPHGMVDEDGMLDLRKIRAAFSSGETLYLTKAERLSSSLMQLCRAVELDLVARGIGLRKPVGAHVFLTPPGSQGFPAHRDEHASFVLQLEGSKEWIVYEPSAEPPAAPGTILRPGAVDALTLEQARPHTHVLQSGDVLYMPEWWPHQARTSSAHSLHVTVRIFPLRWVDLLIELCADHPALFEPVQPYAVTRPGEILEPLMSMLGSERFQEPLPRLLDEILWRHAVPRVALPNDGLRQVLMIEQVDLDTRLMRAAGASCTVFEAGGEVCIGFPGGVIRGPSLIREVFEYVAVTTTLRPRDLPPIAGRDYDRLSVARTMIRDGLLRIADSEVASGSHPGPAATNASSNDMFQPGIRND